ncbi:MAG: NUDIX domain-containing protein, partial [Balneolaceae bacterium]
MSEESLFADKVRVRSCAVIINQGKVLLIKQKAPTRSEPIWLPPGGGVEMGESSQKAVIREVFEETHLTISPKKLLYVHEFIEP